MELRYEFQPAFKGRLSHKRRVRTFANYGGESGVYLIKEDGIVVYVGMSRSCVVKACYRHFYKWTSWKQRRVVYRDTLDVKEYTVMIIPMYVTQAHDLEKALILTMNPRDNYDRYIEYLEKLKEGKIKFDSNENKDIINEYEHDDLPF